MLRSKLFWLSSVSLLVSGAPAWAQDAPADDDDVEIVVTAQRTDQRLQDVPIAVSAFSGEQLEKQQIKNASDLQLTLPNVVFTKGNFTGSSFTIRGIGDLCVGVSCDSATAIHLDGTPLLGTRLFETEYFDMQRIEVLRGPQGTLFGRNATSGVVNFIPNRPDLSGFSAAAEAEYGNYDAIKAKGMVNLAMGDTVGLRVAGFYLKRDGYTKNTFNNTQIDGRDMYSIRGTLRFEPSENTRITLMASYFREDDDRLRAQKQVCQRDPTGVLGCLPNYRAYQATNGNSTFVGVLTSREFLAVNGIPTAFGLGSLYGPDAYASSVIPPDPRVVTTDFTPTYFTDEQSYQARLEQDFDKFKVQLTGFYHKTRIDSQQDYNLAVQDRSLYTAGLSTLAAAAAGGIPGLPASYFSPIASALIPGGPAGNLCTSLSEETGTGAYGNHKICSTTPQDFDRSNSDATDWSAEGIISSDFDGMFNFLLGGIYVDYHLTENSYYVNAFGIDYLTGLLGTFNALGRAGLAAIPGAQPPPPGYLGTPFFRNNTDDLRVKSYGIFGEGYFQFNDDLKLTLGIRYNNDKKTVVANSTLASFLTPFSSTSVFSSPYVYGYAVTGAPLSSRLAPYDADPKTPCTIVSTTTSGVLTPANLSGCELQQVRNVAFDEFTGRAVIDWKVTPDNLLYASYSRGYKSGGINPPLQPVFAVAESFGPEFVDAFEIGSKNTFAGGKLIFNLTAFYYKYKQLQLSRIVARTSVNDNVDANIWGLEAEAIIRPSRDFQVNLGFSYLHAEVSQDKFLSNPRDPSGGRSDAVIIKDITNGSNCAVIPNVAGNAAATQGFVGAVNAGLGLRAPAPFPSDSGLTATGAFSICSVLQANQGANFTVLTAGVPVNIKGNTLPQAPTVKASAGAQYTHRFGDDWTLVPRLDVTMTGSSFGNIFNGSVNRIPAYWQMNAQVQLNGPDDKFFLRGFIQNVTNEQPITGLYVTDQSSGLFTNIFTMEPRRYGIAAGFKF
ncbi:MAG: TonB-dependent receptor [Novosphingobium sp.]